jgi:predicted transporter
MARFLGGTFGVVLVVAVFLATGNFHSAGASSSGFGAAMRLAGLLSLAAALVALALPDKRAAGMAQAKSAA